MVKILNTRLLPPKNTNLIDKSNELNNKLSLIDANKVTTVIGGAAIGKSTLISEYIKNKKDKIWFTIDDSCNDLVSFWSYMIMGFRKYLKDENAYLDILNPLINKEDIYTMLSSLINEITFEDEIYIVLDDFYFIKDQYLLKSISFFIENTWSNVHFIFISRYEIPIYLGKLMVKEGLLQINADALYLNYDEAKILVKKLSIKEVNEDKISEIYNLTEGWIGAIKLITSILNSKSEITKLPKDNKIIMEFIHREVMDSLTREEYDFLVMTSPLSYITNQLYGYINVDNCIQGLIDKNIPIIILDEDEGIYRYHNLFRDYLFKLFEKYSDEKKNKVINGLIKYLIDTGNYYEIIKILKGRNRYNEALEYLNKYGHLLGNYGILEGFPEDYYSKNIDLAFITMFYSYLDRNYNRCMELCKLLIESNNIEAIEAVNTFRLMTGDTEIENCHFKFDSNKVKEWNLLTKVIYYLLGSCALGYTGEYKKALELIHKIKSINKRLENVSLGILSEFSKLSILEDMGKLNESERLYKKIDKLILDKEYKTCFAFYSTIGLPGIYIKELRDKEAEALLDKAYNALQAVDNDSSDNSTLINIYYNLAEVKYIQGKLDECKDYLEKIEEVPKGDRVSIEIKALKINLLSLDKMVSDKEYDVFLLEYNKAINVTKWQGKVGIAYGTTLFAKKKYKEALEFFEELIFTCRKNSIYYYLVYSLLWKVIILKELGEEDTREIVDCLKEAIYYSRDEDLLFPYLKNRILLKDIFVKYKDQIIVKNENRDFINKVNRIFNDDNSLLSNREKEVLQCIIDGLTNKQISEKLFISVATVKTHIINIYSKLGVKNRVEAANKGKEIK